MLRSRVIPCLLIHNGGLVKTVRFTEPKYVGDPLNAVKIFNEKAVDELIIIDIDASVEKRPPDIKLLSAIAAESRMPLCYGGGIHSAAMASEIVALGFEKISVSSAAVERPALIRNIADEIGSQSVVLTLDVAPHRIRRGYCLRTHNGTRKNGSSVIEMCMQAEELGAGEIVINAIHRDGTLEGYDLELAKMIRDAVSVPLTFVGGAGCIDDIEKLFDTVGTVGAAVGSMFVFKGKYRAVLISYARPDSLMIRDGMAQ